MAVMLNHHEWAVAFGVSGNIISFLVFLAPVPTFYRICKKKSTERFQCIPYQVALFSCMLWLYYALLKSNAMLLVTINAFGCIVEAVYVILFMSFATKASRNSTIKVFVLMNVGAFTAILLLTHYLAKDVHTRVVILGWICVGFAVSVFAAPLSIVAHVIRTKSVEFMPFTLSCFLTLSAVMWFAYGAFLRDICIALPNILGFVLGLLQMLLYLIYRKPGKAIEEEKKQADQELKSIVVMSTSGNSEVHPCETQVGKEDKQKQEQEQEPKQDQEQEQKQDKILESSSGLQLNDSPV